MNEGSSRYLDRLVVTKILRDKLTRVRNAPPLESFREAAPFADLDAILGRRPRAVAVAGPAGERWVFDSPVLSPHAENWKVILYRHAVQRPRGNVLFVHGLFDDSLALYAHLTSMLNENGLSVYQLTLPFHYERKPAESRFGGEYFWSANLLRSSMALKQAMYDLIVAHRLLEEETGLPTLPVGFSMGGGVTLRALTLRPSMELVFLINPVSLIARLAWDNPLCRTIREELEQHGWDLDRVSEFFLPFEPLGEAGAPAVGRKVVLARGLYDEIICAADYELLTERVKPGVVHEYQAGHINILRVPRLAMDVAEVVRSMRGWK